MQWYLIKSVLFSRDILSDWQLVLSYFLTAHPDTVVIVRAEEGLEEAHIPPRKFW